MSFIVSGIDAPKSCYECVLEFTFFKHCNCGKLEGLTEKDKNGLIYTKSRHPKCPLKEIKDQISLNLYDIEELHDNCTVQILKNSITGEQSVGWWEND